MTDSGRRRKLSRPNRPDRRSSRFRSGLSILPSLFTVGNIFCGYYAVISTHKGNYDQAAVAIWFGYILDGLDGRIARLTQTTSEFGVQLDSLADVLTFGIAPAMLAFSWGLDSMGTTLSTFPLGDYNLVEQHVRSFGWIATFAFVICGALRLARFNVQAQKPAEVGSKRYFVGLPIPAGAGLVASIVHVSNGPIQSVETSLLWCLLVLLTSFLMISTIRYHSFKEFDIRNRSPRMVLVTAAMLIGLIFYYSKYMLVGMAAFYVASGPVSKVFSLVRRLVSPASREAHETAHDNIKP